MWITYNVVNIKTGFYNHVKQLWQTFNVIVFGVFLYAQIYQKQIPKQLWESVISTKIHYANVQ
ncbi:hypothetical protein BOQ64_00500 [Chryseobacterium sp. CH25]|nr:hypothetical protein BOQ64_00500 [Chryseobacterium sp. CH25]RXM65873.1 hypothetical protein BOQ60_09005 [Chryseobacterium sp. CH1]